MAKEAIAMDVDFQSASSASSCEELPAAESLTSDSSAEGPLVGAVDKEEEEVVQAQAGEPLENERHEDGKLLETGACEKVSAAVGP